MIIGSVIPVIPNRFLPLDQIGQLICQKLSDQFTYASKSGISTLLHDSINHGILNLVATKNDDGDKLKLLVVEALKLSMISFQEGYESAYQIAKPNEISSYHFNGVRNTLDRFTNQVVNGLQDEFILTKEILEITEFKILSEIVSESIDYINLGISGRVFKDYFLKNNKRIFEYFGQHFVRLLSKDQELMNLYLITWAKEARRISTEHFNLTQTISEEIIRLNEFIEVLKTNSSHIFQAVINQTLLGFDINIKPQMDDLKEFVRKETENSKNAILNTIEKIQNINYNSKESSNLKSGKTIDDFKKRYETFINKVLITLQLYYQEGLPQINQDLALIDVLNSDKVTYFDCLMLNVFDYIDQYLSFLRERKIDKSILLLFQLMDFIENSFDSNIDNFNDMPYIGYKHINDHSTITNFSIQSIVIIAYAFAFLDPENSQIILKRFGLLNWKNDNPKTGLYKCLILLAEGEIIVESKFPIFNGIISLKSNKLL